MEKTFVIHGHPEDIALLKACYEMMLPGCRVRIITPAAASLPEASPASPGVLALDEDPETLH